MIKRNDSDGRMSENIQIRINFGKLGDPLARSDYFSIKQRLFVRTSWIYTRSKYLLNKITSDPIIACPMRPMVSHRHFPVQHRCAGAEAFGGVDDAVGVDTVVAVEILDRAGLAEMLDA